MSDLSHNDPTATNSPEPRRRHRWIWLIPLTLGVILLAASIGYLVGVQQRQQARQVAFGLSADEQWGLALEDLEARRFELARQRIEYVIRLDPLPLALQTAAPRVSSMKADLKADRASIARHKVRVDCPLTEIARKYYGLATEPYGRVSYEANKGTDGRNPCKIRPGIVISIPELPPSLIRNPRYAANRHPDPTALRVRGLGMVWEPDLGRPARSGRKP